jgi:hypothetical protein
MTETPDEAAAVKRGEDAAAELTRASTCARVGFIDIEGLEIIAHLADDRLLALSGAKERMLGAGEFGALVRAYLLERQEPDVRGNMGLARARLMMGIVDGLREFTRIR